MKGTQRPDSAALLPAIDRAGEDLASAAETWTELPCVGETAFSDGGLRRGTDYMHARFRSPVTGRFLSVDQVGGTRDAPQTWNRYQYSQGNPIKMIDPSGNVAVTFTIRTFIPSPEVGFLFKTFRGDSRGFHRTEGSARTTHTATIETDPEKAAKPLISANFTPGRTTQLSGSGGRPIKHGTATGESGFTAAQRLPGGSTLVIMRGNESNPLVAGSPGISYEFMALVSPDGQQIVYAGSRDGFPGYEGYVDSESREATLFQFAPGSESPLSLFPPMEHIFLGTVYMRSTNAADPFFGTGFCSADNICH